jgi:hypothetical protein
MLLIRIARVVLIFAAFLLLCQILSAEPNAAHPTLRSTSIGPMVIGAEDLQAQIRSGEPLNYDNITVIGNINLTGIVSQSVKITNSRILDKANFDGAIFSEPLDLRGTVFRGDVSFARVRFLGDARFVGTSFHGQADFMDDVFNGLASFTGGHFFNDSSFGNVQFNGDAVFAQSRFAKDVDFNYARFFRSGSFLDANFQDVSFFETQFGGQATFRNVLFRGNATFAATRFDSDVVFRAAQFLGGSTFGLSSFGGLADFGNVHFENSAFFGGVKFVDLAYFVNARFDRDMILEEARLYSMQLDNVTFQDNSRINLNSTDFTKFVVHWNVIKNRMVYNGAAYLALVKNYKSLEWFDEADDCYYQYRRIGQSEEPWGWTKLTDIISWLSCGYGVRVSYTSFWCLFTILLFGVIFWVGKGMNKFEIEGMELPGDIRQRPSKRASFTDALYFSIAMFTTSQAPVNTYPVGFYRHLAMVEGIMGWFFLGLFVVVLSGVLIR